VCLRASPVWSRSRRSCAMTLPEDSGGGQRDGGVEGDHVWMTCTCGARIERECYGVVTAVAKLVSGLLRCRQPLPKESIFGPKPRRLHLCKGVLLILGDGAAVQGVQLLKSLSREAFDGLAHVVCTCGLKRCADTGDLTR
jgi:hypothetical protein